MKLEFDSRRLWFRPLSEDDLDLSLDLWTNPNVAKYVGGVCSEEKLKEDHPITMRRCGGGCIGVWVLTTKSNNKKIGSAILLPMPVKEDDTNWDLLIGEAIPDCEIEVGYILKEDAWGHGYATEACKRLLKFAFEESPLAEVVAVTDMENLASQHVLLKSGLRRTGIVEAYAERLPGFKITKEQWKHDMSVAR